MPQEFDKAILNAALRQDLGTFIAKVFQTVSPGDEYRPGWHIDAIAYLISLVHSGAERRVIVTQPPRSLKSICVSVAYVAWALGHNPSLRFACVSYSQELSTTFSRQFRSVVTSDWYRALFPKMRITKDTETECLTSQGGGRITVSVGGSFTGRGADVIIIDDPMKADDAHSELARRHVIEWFSTTLLSRLDDKETGAIILVMQRLHEDDLAGKLLSNGEWTHLNLPAIAQEDQEIPIGSDATHTYSAGDALQPERESLAVLDQIRREMGSLAFSAQYLQQPIPAEGNLVKRKWIRWYQEQPPHETFSQIVESWDVASTTGVHNDYSVCTTWGIRKQQDYYLLNVWRGRLEFPQLRKKYIELAKLHQPNTILIEKPGPGLQLLQEFRLNSVPGVPRPIGIMPDGSKIDRMAAQCTRFESDQVHMPADAPWLGDLLHELLAFPHGRHDDQVDSVSQFLNWAECRASRSPTVGLFGPKVFVGGRQVT
jgi:predicted phage terminase large subunit-like protein